VKHVDLVGGDADQNLLVVNSDQGDFLARRHREALDHLQTLMGPLDEALAILQFAQRPQQAQQQANHQGKAE
jgi:hypothetical protein